MMTSYRHSKEKRGAGSALLMTVSGLVLLVVLLDVLLGGRIRGIAQGGASVIWNAVGSASTAIDQSGIFASRQSLAAENSSLREKIGSFQALQTTNVALADENASLRSLLNAPVLQSKALTLGVLSSPDTSPYGTIVLMGGISEGVIRGSWVMVPGGVIVGTVADVNAKTSLVDLFLAPGVKTQAILASSTTEVMVIGRGGGNGLALVPRDTLVSIGDVVYYIDHHSILGVVGSIASSPSDAEKTLYLRIPLNLNGLHFVTVVPSSL